jgi:hypothetical protein
MAVPQIINPPSKGGIVIRDSHVFADTTERDVYFAAHPTELVSGIYIQVGPFFQKYVSAAWVDVSAVVRGLTGAKGDQGDPGPIGPQGNEGPAGDDGQSFVPDLRGQLSDANVTIGEATGTAEDYYFILVDQNGDVRSDPEEVAPELVGDMAGHLVAFNGLGWLDYGQITGVPGQKGDQGDEGPMGPQGPQGEKGEDGSGVSDHTQLTNNDAVNQHPITTVIGLTAALAAKLAVNMVGAANGAASLDALGLVPSTQLPSIDHRFTGHKDAANQHPATSIAYVNTTSELDATEVQAAIDEIVATMPAEAGMNTATVTIATGDWSTLSATKTVTGMTPTAVVFVAPAAASFVAYGAAQIRATSQGAGTLTFACTTLPTESITVNVAWMEAS